MFRRFPAPLRILSLLACASFAGAAEDWKPLFNGRDLTGWTVPSPNPHWSVADGVLVGRSDAALSGSMLWTEKSYRDFIWEGEVRWTSQADSGIMFREPVLQMQIGTSISLKQDMTGSFYISRGGGYIEAGQARDAGQHLKPGDWNKIRLQAKGTTFTVWINGALVVAYSDPKFSAAGPIGLQVHQKVDMKAEFRNVRVLELPAQ